MAEDDDEFRADDGTGVFQTAEQLAGGDVSSHAGAEDIAEAEVKEDLRRRTRINAAQHSRHRELACGRAGDLAAVITLDALSAEEALIACAENFQHSLRCEAALHFAGGVIDELDVIAADVVLLQTEEAHLDAVRQRGLVAEVGDEVADVRVDVVGVASVDEHASTAWDFVQCFFEGGTVEEAHLIRQLDAQHIARGVFLDDLAQRAAQVAVQDEENADAEADEHAGEQIGEDDGGDGDRKGKELAATFAPHLFEELRTR